MRAPDATRPLDEIVRDIVDAIEAAKDNNPNPIAEEVDNRGVTALEIRAIIKTGRALFPTDKSPMWGYRQENREHFAAVQARIELLQEALKEMPGRALALLFAPEVSGTTSRIPTEATQAKALVCTRRFTGMLRYLKARCVQLLDEPPGEHRSSDFRAQWVVEEAVSLLERHYKVVTNSSSSESALRKCACLLWEGLSGEFGRDLERACRKYFEKKF
jgi:hypothetical protein